MPAAIARLRDTCQVAEHVLADAEAALVADPPQVASALDYLQAARRILAAGVRASRCGLHPPVPPDASPRPPESRP